MPYQHLRRADDGLVTTVTLSRPDSHNALNADLIGELTRCFEEISDDESVRVVVLAGEGRSFCAGADIGYMRETATFSYEENLEDARRLAMMYWTIDECPKPLVARVQGATMGGGAGLVAVADVAVADSEARFAFSEVRLGIAPASISQFVVRKVGASHARSLFVTGERFGAERAREIGLVHNVVPKDELDAAVDEKVGELLQGGPVAQATIKALLRRLETTEPMEAPGLSSRVISELRTGEEGKEGLAAFLEKRDPRWRTDR
ncbi:MAG: enoyl-CoA hydratase/isomerase family protein [Rubrobacteraceae bacterium]|nr:enoyl-CoA hydratase/isomerase family protein [Rubrobacteraceae bacterium]